MTKKPWTKWLSDVLATAMVVTLLPDMPQNVLEAKAYFMIYGLSRYYGRWPWYFALVVNDYQLPL